MTHIDRAMELLKQKYPCSQALLGAFTGDFGLDLKTAFKISTCLGGDMRQGITCGCITGGLMVLELAHGFNASRDRDLLRDDRLKEEEYINSFRERTQGGLNCREILGGEPLASEEPEAAGRKGPILGRCLGIFSASIEILERMLEEYEGELLSVEPEEIDSGREEGEEKNENGPDAFKISSPYRDVPDRSHHRKCFGSIYSP